MAGRKIPSLLLTLGASMGRPPSLLIQSHSIKLYSVSLDVNGFTYVASSKERMLKLVGSHLRMKVANSMYDILDILPPELMEIFHQDHLQGLIKASTGLTGTHGGFFLGLRWTQ